MAKKKQRKQQQPLSPQGKSATAQRIYAETYRAAEAALAKQDGYRQMLGINDDAGIRNIETSLSKEELAAFRLFMGGDLLHMSTAPDAAGPDTLRLMRTNRSTIAGTWETAISELISYAVFPVDTHAVDEKEIFGTMGDIEENIPDTIYLNDNVAQAHKHIHNNYANHITTGIHDILDWDNILEADKISTWAKKTMSVLKSMIEPERLDQLDAQRDRIVTRLAEIVVDTFPVHMRTARNTLREMEYDTSMRPLDNVEALFKNKQTTASMLFNQPKLPALPPELQRPLPLNPTVGLVEMPLRTIEPKPIDKAQTWMWAFLCTAELIHLPEASRIATQLLSEFPYQEIVYAAVSVMSKQARKSIHSTAAEVLSIAVLLVRLSNHAAQTFRERLNNDVETRFEFNSFASMQHSDDIARQIEDIRKELIEKGEDVGDFNPGYETLWQIIAMATGVIPQPQFSIRTAWLPILKELGMTSDEAAAICGYIAGMRIGHVHNLMTDVYIAQFIRKRDEDNDDHMAPFEEMKEHYEERLNAMKAHADEVIDELERKALKDEKYARYEATRLEARLKEAENSLAEAQTRMKRLKAENKALQATVNELSMSIEEDKMDDMPDEDTPDTNIWPSDIGKDFSIVSFGGSANWVAAMSQRFPNIRFFGVDVLPNADLIENADIILCNTFVMKHKRFWPIQNAAARFGKTLSYFTRKGINACSERIIEIYAEFTESAENQ